ncbi:MULTISPECIES: NAD(P)/FAD-dependent oxidoreductase [unclassified Phenylobacterium]|uniref:NAD(P)/FAD-dependent oxidoreductase n=1 Tax=unclassified Phenylobacterium TaxID=2640670 RepID=UPI0022645F4A|nr:MULTISPECIES: FAD-dependent oxidoreductase [unclassified Phenylobacterium]MCX7585866.1 FAD-dependent oxidoreductase [Phenylobacterium sp. 58.2.17]WGU40583.1 FAD-dependent oxidoreductase [Phenylobacterium sp. NIBR 498073]
MSQSDAHVVILGAGHAGGTAAALLRQYGHAGPITMVGDEPIPPYQRPPLSKAWLKGEADADSLALKPLEFYAEQNIDFRPNLQAVKLARSDKVVTLSDGSTVSYDILIIATGMRAIRLPIEGVDLQGVLTLRTAADAEAIKAALGPGKRLAIVGGGYIGLEVAASARALGAEAVVIEREARILARSACEPLSNFFHGYHVDRGVQFLLGASVAGFVGENGKVTGVRLADGRVEPCDLVLLGVGAIPNDDIARDAGLECARGIVVDLEARTADPSVFAIGDVTHRPMPHYGRMFGPESVPSALEQAKQAASAITGRPAPTPEVPWNWSDQYDLKLQIAGLPFDADRVLLRGDPASGKFAVFHLKGDQVQSVEAINSPPEFMMGKQLIANRKPINAEKLADPTVSMKEVAA